MMNAEAMTQEEPRLGELIALMGWPWKLALALLGGAAALLLLPRSGVLAATAWSGDAALACAAGAALLALGGGLHRLRLLLRGSAAEPAPLDMEAQDLVSGLRQLLEEQRRQMHEATAAVSRAVTTGAQLSGLANSVEKQFRQALEQVGPVAAEAAPAALPARLEAVLQKLEGALPDAALSRIEVYAQQMEAAGASLGALPALAGRMEASSLEIQHGAAALAGLPEAAARLLAGAEQTSDSLERLAGLGAAWEGLPPAAAQLATGMERVGRAAEQLEAATQALGQLPENTLSLSAAAQGLAEQTAAAQLQSARMARMSQRMEGLLGEAMQHLATTPAAPAADGSASPADPVRLEELVRSLGGHVERVLRNEAALGDAARYLTETTDRFAAGLTALETHGVRLQALISIAGHRETEAGPLREELAELRQQITALMELGHKLDTIQHQLGEAPPPRPAMRATLERLGMVEADAAQLLQEAAAMAQQALPPAFAGRTAELLQAVQENIRHLHAAASALHEGGPTRDAA